MDSILELLATVHRLRAPGGCPWDREQTHQSLRPHLIEEAYEALDVLDRVDTSDALVDDGLRESLIEELGDVLMQVLIHSAIAQEAGYFSFQDVAKGLNAKLIRRHPHVFGAEQVANSEQAYQTWEARKAEEKKAKNEQGVLSGLPRGMPALERTERLIEKVSKVGFQWPDIAGPKEKVREELNELEEAIAGGDKAEIRAELGDLLFAVCNLGFMLKERPSDALRECLSRFQSRFTHLESRMRDKGQPLAGATLAEMDVYWQEAKSLERETKE